MGFSLMSRGAVCLLTLPSRLVHETLDGRTFVELVIWRLSKPKLSSAHPYKYPLAYESPAASPSSRPASARHLQLDAEPRQRIQVLLD